MNRDELSKKQWRKLLSRLTFLDSDQNEWKFYRWRRQQGIMEIPRGAWWMPEFDHVEYEDRRSCPKMPELDFTLKLDATDKNPNFAGQTEAVETMLKQEQGLVVRMPGSGKSQIGLAFIARCKTRTLVITHTKDLMEQWITYAQRAIPGIDIGIIQGENFRIGHMTIAMVQTLKQYVDLDDLDWWRQFGATLVDETHHAPADTWEMILNNSTSRYRLGLTATEKRADKMDKAITYLVGPVINRAAFEPEIPTECIPVKTGYYFPYRGSFDWGRLVKHITRDDKRNQMIAEIADREVREGNSILVLSRSIDHLERIQAKMTTGRNVVFAASGPRGVRGKARTQLVKNMRSGKIRCALATQLADEGLDVPRLNRVLLIHPGKFDGRIRQQVGRILRAHTDKVDAKVYDFVDDRIPVLRRQWMERKQAYKSMSIPVRKTKGGWWDAYTTKKRKLQSLNPKRSTRSRYHARGAKRSSTRN